MNNFSSFQSQLFRGGVNPNSLSSLNKYSINITLDPSGTDYTQLLDNNSSPVQNAYLINASGSDTYLQVQTATSQNISVADFLPSNQSNVTLYTKYKYHNSATTQSIFSHLFNGLFYDIDFSGTSVDDIYHLVYPGNSFDIRFLVVGSSVISYAISGISEGVVTPESGFLSQVYMKKTVTLGNDASSGIITIDVGDISNAAVAYVPYVHVVRKGQPNIGEYVLTIDNQLQSAVSSEIGYHYFDVTDLAGEVNSDYIAFSTISSDAGYGNYSVNVDTSVGNYVRIMVNENTPDLYYTSPSFPGGTFFSPNSYDVLYVVKVVTNVAGQNVYAFDLSGDDVYYNQPDLSFVSGNKYKFDVSDPSNDGYTLSFATTVDTTPDETYVTRVSSDSAIFLDLYSYIGAEPYVYFEGSNAGMGYVEASTEIFTTLDTTSVINTSDAINGETGSAYTGGNANVTTSFTLTNHVDDYKNGTYKVKVSYEEFNNQLLFTLINQTNTNFAWHTSTSMNYSRTVVGGSTYTGKWVEVTIPYAIQLTRVDIGNRTFEDRYPKTMQVLGSNDGGYTLNYIQTITGNNNSSPYYRTITTTETYSTFCIVITQTHDAENIINMQKLEFSGYPMVSRYPVNYTVIVANSVFELSGTPQLNVLFTAGTIYVFDQSDSSNTGEQIVFGTSADSQNIYTTGVTIVGSPGRPGAYTQIEVPSDFVGTLYYYSLNTTGMGYLEIDYVYNPPQDGISLSSGTYKSTSTNSTFNGAREMSKVVDGVASLGNARIDDVYTWRPSSNRQDTETHWIRFDLLADYVVKGIVLQPRIASTNKCAINQIKVTVETNDGTIYYLSNVNNDGWSDTSASATKVKTGYHEHIGDFDITNIDNTAYSKYKNLITFATSKTCRYVEITVDGEDKVENSTGNGSQGRYGILYTSSIPIWENDLVVSSIPASDIFYSNTVP